MNHPLKIMILWIVFLLGLLFHTELGLMPLFHGLSVAHSEGGGGTDISAILWLMLAFFSFPMLAIIVPLFTESRRYRRVHFGITVVYTVLNLAHLGADLFVTPIIWPQITLMLILVIIGLVLNLVSWRWLHEHKIKVFQREM
jgi:hypothetical protein